MDQQTYTAIKAFDTVNQRFEPGDTFLPGELVFRENGLSFDDLRQRRFVAKSDSATAEKAVDRAEDEGRAPLVPADPDARADLAEETTNAAARQLAEAGERETKRSKT